MCPSDYLVSQCFRRSLDVVPRSDRRAGIVCSQERRTSEEADRISCDGFCTVFCSLGVQCGNRRRGWRRWSSASQERGPWRTGLGGRHLKLRHRPSRWVVVATAVVAAAAASDLLLSLLLVLLLSLQLSLCCCRLRRPRPTRTTTTGSCGTGVKERLCLAPSFFVQQASILRVSQARPTTPPHFSRRPRHPG